MWRALVRDSGVRNARQSCDISYIPLQARHGPIGTAGHILTKMARILHRKWGGKKCFGIDWQHFRILTRIYLKICPNIGHEYYSGH